MNKNIYQDSLNEFDNKLKEYAIELVKAEMEKLHPAHKVNFDKMFGSIDKEPIDQLRQFYRICKMTIEKYERPISILPQ
jgi:ribosomal protein S7